MKMVERVLEKMLCRIVIINEMYFDFMPEGRIIDAEFILRRLQEVCHAKGKSCICVLWTWRKLFNLLTEYEGKCWNRQCGRKKYKKFWLDQ